MGTRFGKNGKIESFYIDLIGCEKRKLDAERILQFMKQSNYHFEEENFQKADIIIFVSCGFNEEFSERSKQRIDYLLAHKKPDSQFFLSGCLPSIWPEYVKSRNISQYFGPRELEKFTKHVKSSISIKDIPEQNVSFFDDKDYPKPNMEYRSILLEEYVNAKNGFKIRVNWGCSSYCSYCAIRKATKKLKSKPLAEIKQELEKGLTLGHDSFFFTGGDVGAYGKDSGSSIVALLELITSYNNINIYVQEFNVQWLVKYEKEIADLLRGRINKYNKLFLNVPVQSGSNTVLQRMKRPYTSEQVSKVIKCIRYRNPKIYIGTHVIVGFHGESEADHLQTVSLIKDVNFDFLMPFNYSDHPKTEAYTFNNKVPATISEQRRIELLNEQKKLDVAAHRFLALEQLPFDDLNALGSTIDGWLTVNEARLLHSLGQNLVGGNAVEIGSWKGRSTFFLAVGMKAAKTGRKLHSVDHHAGSLEQRERTTEIIHTLDEFLATLKTYRLGEVVNVHVMDSITASQGINEPLALIFIDGSHEYAGVRADFEAWWPKLQLNGIIALHDTVSKAGVSRLVEDIIRERKDIRKVAFVDEIIYFHKCPETDGLSNSEKKDVLVMKIRNEETILALKRETNALSS